MQCTSKGPLTAKTIMDINFTKYIHITSHQCKSQQVGPLLTCLLINPATRHRVDVDSGKRHLCRAVCRREGPVCPSRRGVQRIRDRRVMLASVRRQRHLSGTDANGHPTGAAAGTLRSWQSVSAHADPLPAARAKRVRPSVTQHGVDVVCRNMRPLRPRRCCL